MLRITGLSDPRATIEVIERRFRVVAQLTSNGTINVITNNLDIIEKIEDRLARFNRDEQYLAVRF